jgi:hypothetical protein
MKYAQGAGHRVLDLGPEPKALIPPEFSPPAKGECPKGEGVVLGVTQCKFFIFLCDLCG